MTVPTLSVSIVTYAPDMKLLTRVVDAVRASAAVALTARALSSATLTLVDNGPGSQWTLTLQELTERWPAALGPATVVSGHGNVGYGRGHNLAISSSRADWHLVLNPDAVLEPDTLRVLLARVGTDPSVALATPRIVDEHGEQLYLCRRYPSLLDLWLRGFAPSSVRRRCQARLDRYELRDVIGDQESRGVPIVSGCFMLGRTRALQAVGGFSDAFFMYFEDYDLSLRLHAEGHTLYVPSARITHYGGHAARKGWRHVLWFGRSAVTFFGRHGWKLW